MRTSPWVAQTLVAASVAFLAFACWSLWGVQRGEAQDLAADRDRALVAAKQRIASLNSMDARQVDAGLKRWEDASTGALQQELGRTRAASKNKIVKAGTSAEGSVLEAALLSLDARAGSARAIASVKIQITGPDGAATVQRKRYEAGLARTSSGWKLTSLTALPVDAR
ncbi:hypothetical protein [Spirillospora sp. CA-294931]|uniref:hypothetical protein n=1 Tax=Spirillospora sp. CA-294931 TaxID=3240042 RepID=UPI003D92F814